MDIFFKLLLEIIKTICYNYREVRKMASYAYNEEITSYYVERRTRTNAILMPSTHYHNHYEIYYLRKGKARYFIDNITFDLNEGDMVLIPPYVIHRTAYIEGGELERLLITFTLDFMGKAEDDPVFRCFDRYCIKKADVHKSLINSIETENNNPDEFSDELIKNYITSLLIRLSRITEKTVFEITAPLFVQQITEYITENYATEITLDELSKQFSVSKSHLSRQFKSTTGFGINEYITIVRVKNAERLILTTDMSITDIATKCGFNDSNYFSSVFKKLKGISPLKFRSNNL